MDFRKAGRATGDGGVYLDAYRVGGVGDALAAHNSGERLRQVRLECGGQSRVPVDVVFPAKSGLPNVEGPVECPILEDLIQKLFEKLSVTDYSNLSIRLEIHEGTGQFMVIVTRRDTGEVVKVIPPREWLDTLAAIQEYIGLILDERA